MSTGAPTAIILQAQYGNQRPNGHQTSDIFLPFEPLISVVYSTSILWDELCVWFAWFPNVHYIDGGVQFVP